MYFKLCPMVQGGKKGRCKNHNSQWKPNKFMTESCNKVNGRGQQKSKYLVHVHSKPRAIITASKVNHQNIFTKTFQLRIPTTVSGNIAIALFLNAFIFYIEVSRTEAALCCLFLVTTIIISTPLYTSLSSTTKLLQHKSHLNKENWNNVHFIPETRRCWQMCTTSKKEVTTVLQSLKWENTVPVYQGRETRTGIFFNTIFNYVGGGGGGGCGEKKTRLYTMTAPSRTECTKSRMAFFCFCLWPPNTSGGRTKGQ